MKTSYLTGLFLLIIYSSISGQENLVLNGNFDNWAKSGDIYNNLPDSFSTSSTYLSSFSRIDGGKTGNHALRVVAPSNSHRRFNSLAITLDDGDYIGKVWLKGRGLVRWVSLTKEGSTATSTPSDINYVVRPMGGVTTSFTKLFSDWTELIFEFKEISAGKYNMHFSLLDSEDETAPFMLDDLVLLKRITETGFGNVLYPTDDTYLIGSGQGTNINGLSSIMYTYCGPTPEKDSRESYLKFDLSEMINPQLIEEVKLNLYAEGTGQSNIHTLNLHRFDKTDWSEDQLTSNNKSSLLGSSAGVLNTLQTSLDVSQYYIWDITDGVKNYLQNAQTNLITLGLLENESQLNENGDAILVNWHSKENINRPILSYTIKNIDHLLLTDLLVDGIQIESFNPQTFFYEVGVPYESADTDLPNVTAISQNNTTLSYSYATNLSGNVLDRTTQINVRHDISGDVLTYKVLFFRFPPDNDPTLKQITIDGVPIENFEINDTIYHQYLPYSYEGTPDIKTKTVGRNSTYNVVLPKNIFSENEDDRLAIINVTSGDLTQTKKYQVLFEVMPKLDLFLCVGQSNMAGRGPIDVSKGDLNPIENCFLFTPMNNWEIASNPMNKYSSIRKELNQQRIGPSYSFSKKTASVINDNPLGLVVNAKGATVISWWLKNSTDTLYKSTIRRAKEAQKWGEFKAILWHQGEGDSGANLPYYPGRLKMLVDDLRSDLNSPELFFLAGELAYWRGGGTGSTGFNEMIRTIDTFIDNAAFVSAEGLSPVNGDENDPHFDRESQLIFGERYADIILKKVYGIEGTNDLISSINNPVKINIQNRQIIIEVKGLHHYSIFSPIGHQLYSGTLEDIKIIQLPRGLYIIRVGPTVKKVLVP